LVVMIAREYQKAFKNLLDLVQEGNMGLMEAVKNFDPYRGVRFPSYAVWWIRAYMIRYIMNDWRMVKIGTTQAQRKLFFNLQKEKEKIETEGLTPGPKLLAQRLNVKEDEVVEMEQRLASRDLSVDMPMGDDEEATLLHFLPDQKESPEEQLAETQYQQLLREKMEQFAGALKDKELVIFRERLLNEEPLTLREIGEKYDISRERVRQIEERVKRKLKAFLSKELKDIKSPAAGTG
jgi:RNA polymerase sigma-32 factor